MLARGRLPPIQAPKPPRIAASPRVQSGAVILFCGLVLCGNLCCYSPHGTVEPCCQPRPVVDLNLYRLDRGTPRGTHNGISAIPACNLGRRRFKPGVSHGCKRPDGLTIPLLLTDADIVARHESTGV